MKSWSAVSKENFTNEEVIKDLLIIQILKNNDYAHSYRYQLKQLIKEKHENCFIYSFLF